MTSYDHDMEMAYGIIAMAMSVPSGQHADRISCCQVAAQCLVEGMRASVLAARGDGWSWGELGDVLGIDPLEAERRYTTVNHRFTDWFF